MLAFSPIPMFDRMDHPSVPTTFPWRTAVDGGQGWPHGHREAAAHGSLTGVEALLRWQHPERGLLLPRQFLAIAEDTGMIVAIGQWVLREACTQMREWLDAGLLAVPVAVNISAVQLARGDLEDTVRRALAASGLAPELLELELTESILIRNVDSVLATVSRLKRLGVALSIDDFGTGYSSLTYLKRFAVDKLKIDQSFIRDITEDPNDA